MGSSKEAMFKCRMRKRYHLPHDCSIEECRKHYDAEKHHQERIVNQMVLISHSLNNRGLKYSFAMYLVHIGIIKHYTHFYQLSMKNQIDRLYKPKDIELYANIVKAYIEWDSSITPKQCRINEARTKIDEYFKSKGH